MPRWIHKATGAGQWDFPNLMKFEINMMSGQPLLPGTMGEWSALPTEIWAPINCPLPSLLHILLQHHPLGSLSEFRDNTMIALQQRSPQGIFLGPHFFNHGDSHEDRKSRQISQLIQRATGLQIPGTPLPIYSYPCQDPNSHPHRTGTSQRPAGLQELIQSTSFGLTIYTVLYPQGHSGLRSHGNPFAASPFFLDKTDLLPVYSLMHQSFSDNRLKSHAAAGTSALPTTAPNGHQTVTDPNPPPGPRRLWASEQGEGDTLLHWRQVILIQHGLDKGFTQAPPRAGVDSARPITPEVYQGHVLQVMVATLPTDNIGHMIRQTLALCYPPGLFVPTPDTLHYTLGKHSSHFGWTHDRRPSFDTQINVGTKREIFFPMKTDWNISPWERPPFMRSFPLHPLVRRYLPLVRMKLLKSNRRNRRNG